MSLQRFPRSSSLLCHLFWEPRRHNPCISIPGRNLDLLHPSHILFMCDICQDVQVTLPTPDSVHEQICLDDKTIPVLFFRENLQWFQESIFFQVYLYKGDFDIDKLTTQSVSNRYIEQRSDCCIHHRERKYFRKIYALNLYILFSSRSGHKKYYSFFFHLVSDHKPTLHPPGSITSLEPFILFKTLIPWCMADMKKSASSIFSASI